MNTPHILPIHQRKYYKPLVLQMGVPEWMTPLLLFVIILIVTGPLTWFLNGPIVTSVNLAYMVAFSTYIVRSHQTSLRNLKPVLMLDEVDYEYWKYRLTHFRQSRMMSATGLAIPAMLLVNWSHPEIQDLLKGDIPGFDFFWGLFLAILSWMVILQVIYIVISNTLMFATLAKDHTRIDIFYIRDQLPYTKVGVANILLFAGAYTMIPIAYVDSGSLVLPALLSLAVTLPMALTLFLLPLTAIRSRIHKEKADESQRITDAINGNRTALLDSYISDEAQTIPRSNMIVYRDLVERANEWPITDNNMHRIGLYIIIPLLAWVGAALVERLVDSLF